ncbi:hypothetical protein Tco_0951803 [Tanacetum coccineum]|uniref:Uncharacterized protein n=1 Tax=Tanacetum coccineum TaxID=301880 RepID=A0ABQ5DVW4_9ASTR
MPSVRLQNTANGSTPNPKRTSQTSRSLPTSKSSCVTITVVPKADHSRNSSSFSDSKHFFCSTCHKCVFNANHDACITKLLNEVNSRKVKPHKTKNSNNPVEQKSHTQKPGRQISSGHRLDTYWKDFHPISNNLRFDSEPQMVQMKISLTHMNAIKLLMSVQASLFNDKWRLQTTLQAPSTWSLNVYEMVKLTPGYISSGLVQNPVSPTPYVPPSKKDYEILFQLLFDEYFNPPPRAVSPDPVAVAAPRAVDPADSPSSTTIDQDVPLLVLHQQIRKFNLKSLIELTKNHPLENVIGDPSRPVDTQNRRDLPRDNPLVSVEVLRYDIKRSKSKNKGIVPTEMELVLEQTQKGTSHEVLGINRVNTSAVIITMMIDDIEDWHHGPSDAMHNPP